MCLGLAGVYAHGGARVEAGWCDIKIQYHAIMQWSVGLKNLVTFFVYAAREEGWHHHGKGADTITCFYEKGKMGLGKQGVEVDDKSCSRQCKAEKYGCCENENS